MWNLPWFYLCHTYVSHISVCMQERRNKLSDFADWLLIPVIFSDSLFSSYIPILALIIKVSFYFHGNSLPIQILQVRRVPTTSIWDSKAALLEIDFWLLNTCVLAHNEIFPLRGANTQARHVVAYKYAAPVSATHLYTWRASSTCCTLGRSSMRDYIQNTEQYVRQQFIIKHIIHTIKPNTA